MVINLSGSAIDLSWAKANAAAIVQAWYPGEGGGPRHRPGAGRRGQPRRVANPVTFYKGVADLPAFDDYNMQGRTYRFYKGEPVYGFGYGRATPASAEAPKLELQEGRDETRLVVRTAITNTSSRDGDEVAQLYLTPPSFEGAPRLALQAFERLHLKAVSVVK